MEYAEEMVTDELIEELAPLSYLSWKEVQDFEEAIYEPNWEAYKELNSLGGVRCFTVRDKGELVGYASFMVVPHLHMRNNLHAMSDSIFILPSHRRGMVAVKLLRFAESTMREHGIKVMVLASTIQKDLTRLFEFLGYEFESAVYRKRI